MRRLRVPRAPGLSNRWTWISVDDDYADFLEEQLPILLERDLQTDVLGYVLEHEHRDEADQIVAEFGVFSGTSINRIADRLPAATVYGFDSFEGLPERWGSLPKGSFSRHGEPPEVAENVHLIKGWFSDTLPPFLEQEPRAFSLVHVDCDLFSSTRTILDLLADRMCRGTILILDDLMVYYKEEMRALFESFRDAGKKFEWIGYGYDVGTGIMHEFSELSLKLTAAWIRASSWIKGIQPRGKFAGALRII